MPNIDTTDGKETIPVPTTPRQSLAASRILRAVEKSRGESGTKLEIPAPVQAQLDPVVQSAGESQAEAAAAIPTKLEASASNIRVSVPKMSIDAREALRSLSERHAAPRVSEGSDATSKAKVLAAAIAKAEAGAPKSAEPLFKVEPVSKTVAELLQAVKPAVAAPMAEEIEFAKARDRRPEKSFEKAKAVSVPEAKTPEKTPQKTSEKTASPVFEAPTLGMGPNHSRSFWANLPMVVKAGMFVLLFGAVVGVFFKFSDGRAPKGGTQGPRTAPVMVPMSGIGGWIANWGDPSKMSGRSISLFRPSLLHSDYRIEFEAQIEAKAFGWVFRAKDPQNYYGYKVETVKPGLQPLVALARVTMISGVESQKHYTLLEGSVRPDTVFRVRMDSRGSEFTTWINDKLVEVWQDDRLHVGGVGLFTDLGERAQVRKVQIFETR